MNRKIILAVLIGLGTVSCLGLALSNPTLTQYRASILAGIAKQEVARQEQVEWQAIEREAAALESYFAAAHYEGRRLDAATIQRQYPKLGASLVSQNFNAGTATLGERLSQMKHQMLQRMSVTHETMLYSLLADLSIHTSRVSYGLWSHLSTCHNNRLYNYLGLAGGFYVEDAGMCMSPP